MKRTRYGLARWALGALALVMGVALVFTTWSSFRSSHRGSDLVERGQASALMHSTLTYLASVGGPPLAPDLQFWIDENEAIGLRYFAISLPPEVNKGPWIEAGESATGATPGRDPVRGLTRLGDRVRIESVLPDAPGRGRGLGRLREGAPGPGERFGMYPPPGGGPPMDALNGPPPRVIMEFVPVAAIELREQAARSLIVGIVTAILLLAVTLLAWRMLGQKEKLEARLELDRRLAALGEMSAVLAHEIRNPLASLKGHTQLMAELLAEGSRERGKAERILEEAIRLETLTTELLEFVRSQKVDRIEAPVDLLVEGAVSAIEGLELTLDIANAPKTWRMDVVSLDRALTNVLRNAAQASPPGSAVEVVVSEVKRFFFL